MAKSLEDPQFWLPSQEDLLMDLETSRKSNPTSLCFPSEFPFEFDSVRTNSALSSPGDSVDSSTETEHSHEEDFLAGLTRCLAQSSLNDVDKRVAPSFTHEQHENKYWNMAGSPQSTLNGFGSVSASSNGSPNGPSRVPSPQTMPLGCKKDTFDLIYAAAGEVERPKMSQQGRVHHGSVPLAMNVNTSFQFRQVGQSPLYKQESCPSAAWGRHAKVGWQAQPQIKNGERGIGFESARCVGHPVRVTHPTVAWPRSSLQQPQQSGGGGSSGMRAVFLGGSHDKKKSTGTGVFLPRRYVNPVETRKKSGCATVLIPPKVVQALNLSFDEINGQAQPRFISGSGYSRIHVDSMIAKNNGLLTQQRPSLSHEGPLNHEPRLPPEWTY